MDRTVHSTWPHMILRIALLSRGSIKVHNIGNVIISRSKALLLSSVRRQRFTLFALLFFLLRLLAIIPAVFSALNLRRGYKDTDLSSLVILWTFFHHFFFFHLSLGPSAGLLQMRNDFIASAFRQVVERREAERRSKIHYETDRTDFSAVHFALALNNNVDSVVFLRCGRCPRWQSPLRSKSRANGGESEVWAICTMLTLETRPCAATAAANGKKKNRNQNWIFVGRD